MKRSTLAGIPASLSSMPSKPLGVITVSAFVLLAAQAVADVSGLPDPLFQGDETLDITITGQLSSLVRERPKDEYSTGVLEYTETDGTPVKFDLEIRARGNFRHKNCEYPPVSLNLKKSQTKGTLFGKQNKLKLVIHCDYSERYEQVVLREYLAYRILGAITDMSFQVRLVHVTYVNTEVQGGGQVRYGFLIEHKNRLAKRYDLKDLKIERTSVASIQPDQLNLTSVFEFFIGNTDFSPIAGPPDSDCCHNYVLFGNSTDLVVAVPYDFDQSGFVDAPYAKPDQHFRISNVRQRLYRGRCVNNEHVAKSLQRFRDNRESIYALINDQEGLQSGVRNKLIDYIDDFYDLINDPKKVKQRILKKCI